jgi:hypothetical protein
MHNTEAQAVIAFMGGYSRVKRSRIYRGDVQRKTWRIAAGATGVFLLSFS